jgi:uncharacterized protein (TIGR00255 family)
MTGFACTEECVGNIVVIIEIKGYNSKYSEFNILAPKQFVRFETDMRRLVSGYCRRGKVDINIRVKDAQKKLKISVNEGAVVSYIEAGEKIAGIAATALPFDKTIRLRDLLSLDGVLEIESDCGAEDENWELIKPVFIKVLEAFSAEREREGAGTEENILSYVAILEEAVKKINRYVPELEATIKKNIKERFIELDIDGLDENRILCETAVLLMKYTIAEELFRLGSHLAEFRAEVQRNASPGKKLDFLSQEINREINTIGSKSNKLEVSQLVVDMKDALENIREQLRNIE